MAIEGVQKEGKGLAIVWSKREKIFFLFGWFLAVGCTGGVGIAGRKFVW